MQIPPEKSGSFYLGAEYDLDVSARKENALVYDARDLVTHAVVVGMTGSGKTGMCVGLLEEAALDKIPALIVDPKGDMGNLLLQFPQLRSEDFEPWVNSGDAERKGQTVAEYAAATAEQWKGGLADWGIDGQRLETLKETIRYTIFTPGSEAGVPINIMGSLAAPGLDWESESEAIRERIGGTVAALLGLAQVNVDPVRSREAVLLASLFEHYWRNGQDLDMKSLILAIQEPPLQQIGVVEVDTFYPKKDRFNLAMAFNTIVASPTFQAWLSGEPLDIEKLYYTPDGKPRHSIINVAHLSDSERMFFLTLLLESVVTWVRRQSGTTSLRALLYFDEIFGYLPPVANPPTKRPLLTLLKQARAFGLGVVLVTQNPVDLDYKALSNTGTWVIGKLQAERDKQRVMDGLKGAIAESGGGEVDYDATIGKLGSRVFLMHNVNQKKPVVFTTRWAQSYLRGPLTKVQVAELMKGVEPLYQTAAPVVDASTAGGSSAAGAAAVSTAAKPPASVSSAPPGFLDSPPKVSESVQQVFLPLTVTPEKASAQIAAETGCEVQRVMLTYEPAALGAASVLFQDRRWEIEEKRSLAMIAPFPDGPAPFEWDRGEALGVALKRLSGKPERMGASDQGPYYAPVPESGESAADIRKVQSALGDFLYGRERFAFDLHEGLGIARKPMENETDFQARVERASRTQCDAEVRGLQEGYTKKIKVVEDKVGREQAELIRNQSEVSARRTEKYGSWLETVWRWFMGRRASSALSSSMSKQRREGEAQARVKENEYNIERLSQEKAGLEAELNARSAEVVAKWDGALGEVTTKEVAPTRSNVNIELVALAWIPSWVVAFDSGGISRTQTVAAYQADAGTLAQS